MDIQELNEFETIALISFTLLSVLFLFKWYKRIFKAWPKERGRHTKTALNILPLAAFFIIFFTLKTLASHDVVNDWYYILFYLSLGFSWLCLGVFIMSSFFNLSWIDDILNMNNKAALFAFTGGYIGLTVIYAAANIGDGPGWGCVVFAGALGLISWVAFALILNLFTKMFERVTIERDVPCGVRLGSFLLATGIILGRASAGDWTSAYMTVVEFMVGWPAIPLTLLAITVELLFSSYGKSHSVPANSLPDNAFGTGAITVIENNISGSAVDFPPVMWSILWGFILILIAVVSITILPSITGNPIHG